ncbi:hypothetical protein [Candidatus Palauibacter sp.]|uniref:hypothetical protein n=1 Tax=Candidatus Palauibacter sp. TaxID=3101350 RepID=UPI003B024249
MSAAPTADVTIQLSAPPAVTLAPTSVTIAAGDTVSRGITVTADHDRNTASESVDITATATSADDNYGGLSATIPAETADDDFALTATPGTVRENDALTDDKATLVTITVKPAPAGDAAEITLGGTPETFEFRPYVKDAEYDPTVDAETMATLVAAADGKGKSASVKVWLLVADDTTDPATPETIQIGAAADGEVARMEPAMITVVDADPEVTLSVTPGEVNEGAEDVTLTVTATAAAPMPGIFEFDLSDLAVTE